jgi:NADH-quinone oxidoreductase subunit F
MPLLDTDRTTVRIASREAETAIGDVLRDADSEVHAVGSTGVPAVEPLVLLTEGGRTAFFAACSVGRAEALLTGLEDGFDSVVDGADAVVEHDPNAARLPGADLPELSAGQRTVLGPCGWLRPTDPDDYETAVGFGGSDPETIRDIGAELLGRGWGDWCQDRSLAESWETAREADGEPTVVVNAHGTRADTLLSSSAPFAVLDGAAAVARAVDAERIVVYISEDDDHAVDQVETAAWEYPDPPVPMSVVTGPAVYRAAEPTMAIEAIEGNHRLEARLRPPGPDETGIHDRPTVVHTARTVAHLAAALDTGSPADSRLVTVTGDVAAPATVELPERARLAAALDAVDGAGEYKAACVGGRFGGLTDSLDVRVDPESLLGAGLGTEGVVELLGEDRCVVKFVGERAQFAADTNCGRCVPCREGTTQLAELLRDLYDGRYRRDGIEELIGVMERSSICTFGVDAGRPTRTAMTEFESEFHAHADGRCPAGSCPRKAEVSTT